MGEVYVQATLTMKPFLLKGYVTTPYQLKWQPIIIWNMTKYKIK